MTIESTTAAPQSEGGLWNTRSSTMPDSDCDDEGGEQQSLKESPSAVETDHSGDDEEDEDEGDYDDLDILLEGWHPAPNPPRRFDWALPLPGTSSSFSQRQATDSVAASPATDDQRLPHGAQRRRIVHVTLESPVDDHHGAPSGRDLCPGAQLMVDHMLARSAEMCSNKNGEDFSVSSIVQLGAGSCGGAAAAAGLVALQAWQSSLQCLVLTDRDPGPLERARNSYESTLEDILGASQTEEELNSAINAIASIPACFELLQWDNGSGEDDPSRVRDLIVEHTNDHSDRADLILGTDLIDGRDAVEPLLRTAARLMKPPAVTADGEDEEEFVGGGRFWLSQSSAYGDETEALIDAVCDRLGLVWSTLLEDDEGGRQRVLEFRHRKAHSQPVQHEIQTGK